MTVTDLLAPHKRNRLEMAMQWKATSGMWVRIGQQREGGARVLNLGSSTIGEKFDVEVVGQ